MNEITWHAMMHYEDLAKRYAAPWAYEHIPMLNVLLNHQKDANFEYQRESFRLDYKAYKQTVNASNAPVAFRGSAAVMQQNLTEALKVVKKLRPTVVQRRAVNMHGKLYDHWFAPVCLVLGNGKLTVHTPAIVEGKYTWVKSETTCSANVSWDFHFLVDFDTLYALVKLLDKTRLAPRSTWERTQIRLTYRWLVDKLEIKQGGCRCNLNVANTDSVPVPDALR